MSSASVPQEKRRVGRPRKRESAETGVDPKDQILNAAASLFADRGISEVSMLEIAEGSGLAQSSLYYWFRRKESIVAELLQQVNRLPLAFAKQLKAEGDSPDLQLYRLVRFDVRNVCAFPLEITEVHRVARRDRASFEIYWRERRELTRTLERLIEEGAALRIFRKVDACLCALTIIAQDESVQNWYPRTARAKLRPPAPHEDPAALRYSPEDIGDFVASQTLASVLADEAQLASVQARARESDIEARTGARELGTEAREPGGQPAGKDDAL
jgi:TetR/AcrR family transcriptional regulator